MGSWLEKIRPADDRCHKALRLGRAFLFYFLVIFTIRFGVLQIFNHHDELMDFGSFVASGRAAIAGLNPYGVYSLTYHYADNGLEFDAVNRNPPISALLFQGFAPWDPHLAFYVWYAVSLALYAGSIFLLARSFPERVTPLRIVWGFSLAGVWSMLGLGQIYAPLILLATVAWLQLRQGQRVLPGCLLGVVVAIKPMFLVLPALLLLSSAWMTAVAALVVSAVLSVAPLVVYGPVIYLEWFQALSTQIGLDAPTNGSLLGLTSRLGLPWLGPPLSIVLLIGLAAWTWRRRPSVIQTIDLAWIGALLASPETWTGYTLFLLPTLWSRSWSVALTIAAALLCGPDALVLTVARVSPLHFAAVSYLANVALLLVLVGILSDPIGGAKESRC